MEESAHQEKQQGSLELVLRSDSLGQKCIGRTPRREGLTIEAQVDSRAMHVGAGKPSKATLPNAAVESKQGRET